MKLCVGICGSIAAYRSVDFVKELTKLGHEVRCVLTRGGQEFVSARALETFSNQPVATADIFDSSHFSTDHIATARWADAFIIYGATAHFLARAAQGLGNDFLSLQLLAFTGPVIVAPAMNPAMWAHPAVVANVRLLKERGYTLVGPIEGTVACGETGVGHLASHADILAALGSGTSKKLSKLEGKKVLISAGPMRTALDPVRYLQNRSSGKMGLELARACFDAGADVSVLLGPVSPEMRAAFASFAVTAYEGPSDYEQSLEKLFPACDIFFSAAAVLDFELQSQSRKIERSVLAEMSELKVPLRAVPDIVARFAKQKKAGQKVIAFAAETGSENEIIERATKKMRLKEADALIANPVWPGLGPDSDNNQVWILRPQHEPIARGPAAKSLLAREVLKILFA